MVAAGALRPRAAAAHISPASHLHLTCISLVSRQVLFGLGLPLHVPAVINLVAFACVGLPLGALLAYQGQMGTHGLWTGLLVAIGLVVLGQYAHLARTVDWHEAARAARERALAKDQAAARDGGAGGGAADESDGRGLAMADSAGAAHAEAVVELERA